MLSGMLQYFENGSTSRRSRPKDLPYVAAITHVRTIGTDTNHMFSGCVTTACVLTHRYIVATNSIVKQRSIAHSRVAIATGVVKERERSDGGVSVAVIEQAVGNEKRSSPNGGVFPCILVAD